jgi:hypothetical protein
VTISTFREQSIKKAADPSAAFFLSRILNKRARRNLSHPIVLPRELLHSMSDLLGITQWFEES